MPHKLESSSVFDYKRTRDGRRMPIKFAEDAREWLWFRAKDWKISLMCNVSGHKRILANCTELKYNMM
jgi:hypothetical protein